MECLVTSRNSQCLIKSNACIQLMQVNKYHNSISDPTARKTVPRVSEIGQKDKLLQSLVQNDTRRLIEAAFKFARSAKRQELTFEDVQSALDYLGFRFIKLTPRDSHSPSEDTAVEPVHSNVEEFLKKELSGIDCSLMKPAISGRWVYLNGRVPRTQKNIHVDKLTFAKEETASDEQNNKFSVINDDPMSLLTKDEVELLQNITRDLDADRVPNLQKSNPNNIAPFLLARLQQPPLTDSKVLFLKFLLHNQHFQLLVEHNLHRILSILLHYEGKHMWSVGFEIAQLIFTWGNKYHNLYEELHSPTKNYQQKIRQLAIQMFFKIPIKVEVDTLLQDVTNGVPYALEYQQTLGLCGGRIEDALTHKQLLPEDLVGVASDSYLQTFL